MENQLKTKYGGAKNAGNPMLLEGGLDWKEMSLSPVDMSWLEGQKLSSREIAIAFGVPPEGEILILTNSICSRSSLINLRRFTYGYRFEIVFGEDSRGNISITEKRGAI
jgi:hypothetical protein